MATITCEDCGEIRTRCPSNTLYCQRCRFLREIVYWDPTKAARVCSQIRGDKPCATDFLPVARHDTICADCAGVAKPPVNCPLCKTEAPQFSPHVPVCCSCAKDPQRRIAFIAALAAGQLKRREHNADRLVDAGLRNAEQRRAAQDARVAAASTEHEEGPEI